LELKKRLVEARPFLKQWNLTAESPGLIAFRVAKGEAFFWTWATNLEPKKKIMFT